MTIKFIDRQTGEIKTENPPAEGLLKFLYDHPFGKAAILPIAKRKFISTWYGRIMDKPSSTKRIQSFIDQHQIDMTASQKSVSDFISFNDFFYRKLKPEARPIGKGFVSPGDGSVELRARRTAPSASGPQAPIPVDPRNIGSRQDYPVTDPIVWRSVF